MLAVPHPSNAPPHPHSARSVLAMPVPNIGDIVEAHCRRCKLTLDTSVAAVVGPEIASVVCRTCGEQQRYKPPRDAPTSKARTGRRVVDVSTLSSAKRARTRSRSRSPSSLPMPMSAPPLLSTSPNPTTGAARVVVRDRAEAKAKREAHERWAKETSNVHVRYARPHRIKEAYDPGEAILHKRFGMGIVCDRGVDGTLSVLFREGMQQLPSKAPA